MSLRRHLSAGQNFADAPPMPPPIPAEQHNIEIQQNQDSWRKKPLLHKIYQGFGFYREIATCLRSETAGITVEGKVGGGCREKIFWSLRGELSAYVIAHFRRKVASGGLQQTPISTHSMVARSEAIEQITSTGAPGSLPRGCRGSGAPVAFPA